MLDFADPPADLLDLLVEDALLGVVDTLDVRQAALFLLRDPWDPGRLGGWYSASRGETAPSYERHPGAPPPLTDLFAEADEAWGLRPSPYMPSWLCGLRAAAIFPLRSTIDRTLLGLLYLGRDPAAPLTLGARQAGTRIAARVARALDRATYLRADQTAGADPERVAEPWGTLAPSGDGAPVGGVAERPAAR